MANFLEINGEAVPCPAYGLSMVISTAVNSGRNAQAEVVGERVGRDVMKYDSLKWNFLTAAEWSHILRLMENFFFTAKVFDMMHNTFITIKMYRGDIKATPYFLDPNSKAPTHFKDCQVNIIDCGIIGESLWKANPVEGE